MYTISVDEIREQKGRILLEAVEAKQRLEEAQRKYDAVTNRLNDLHNTFRQTPEAIVARGEQYIPTPHELLEAAKTLVDSRDKLREAEQKKSELGLT